MKSAYAFFFALLLILLTGCGGGGGGTSGGTSGRVNILGRVLWIESGGATSPATTVEAGTDKSTTDPVDGFFQFDVNSGTSSLKLTYAPSGGGLIVRTFTFNPVTQFTDVGDLYIGPSVVTISGRAVDSQSGSPISGGLVTIGGRQAFTQSNGTFNVTNVAFSASNTTVFLGLDGVVSASNYFARHFNPPSLPVAGIVQVGDVALTPFGSVDPPPPPYNLQGNILPSVDAPGSTVQIKIGASILRTVIVDTDGKFQFWLPVGSYTLTASNGSKFAQKSVTITNQNVITTTNVSY